MSLHQGVSARVPIPTPSVSDVRGAGECNAKRGLQHVGNEAFRPPNGTHAKLCGQGPRAEAAAACRLPRARAQTQHAICNLHAAEQVLFGRGASAPGRSRAATASA
jgi:hypothetical protein